MTPRYTFRLKPDRDRDLIDWLDSLGEGERSFFIRQALRQALNGPVVSQKPALVSIKTEYPTATVEATPDEVTSPGNLNSSDIESKLENLAKFF